MSIAQSSNINADDIDDDTKEKLKGDNIGDTLYSQSFVLKTLMQLSDIKWSQDMEQDLCFLWDMTLDKDVCIYLFQLNYPSLACSVIIQHVEERLTEILVGILANLLIADCEKNISDNELQIALNSLESSHPAILIQVMRVIESIAFYMPERIILIGKNMLDKMQYILKYSENYMLITHTLQAFLKLTDNFKLAESEVNAQLYVSVAIGFDTIFSVEYNNFEVEIDMEETSKVVKIFLQLIANLSEYANRYNCREDISTCINHCPKLSTTICRLLKHFSDESNLFPISRDFNTFVQCFLIIFTTRSVTIISDLEKGIFTDIFQPLCKILYYLHKCKSEVTETFNVVLELIAFTIYSVDRKAVLYELKQLQYRRGIVILNSLKENSKSYDFNISENLRFLFTHFK
ncbi:hypothetical protein GWI33_003034 [Rhynchophorus ferrugineus]|uniref:Uncharacterized protein n=1 Tax=Rhynchophorus ferrugineus TaxID=354439 RepID=A0A834IQL3_RHYFE|nr:hypothetical protein GWI33_003034 [Rhynchophorus ferrugineus]